MRKLLTLRVNQLVLWLLFSLSATSLRAADDIPVTYYPDTNVTPATTTSCASILSCSSVSNAKRAADTDFTNYATMNLGLIVSEASIALKLTGTAPAYSRAGVVVSGTSSLVSLNLVGGVKLTTYLNGVAQSSHVVEAALLKAALLSDEPTRLEFQPTTSFNEIKLEYYQTVAASVLNQRDLRVYYAYGSNVGTLRTVTGYVSNTGDYATAIDPGSVGVCLNTKVNDPKHAADTDLTGNYASFSSIADVSCSTTLNVELNGTAPADYYAGFIVGEGSLLDLDVSVLNSLTLKTYLGSTEQESGTGTGLLRLTLLPDGSKRYAVSMKATKPFDRVAIKRNDAASLLNNLRLYFGFGVEPRTFEEQQIVRSDSPSGTNLYRTQSNGVVVVTINDEDGIVNPQNAATGPNLNDYAKIKSLLSLGGTQRLRVKLNGTGTAGSRAGVVLKLGEGLLDASLLPNFRVNTYLNRDDTTPIESVDGSKLVLATVLGGTRSEISFRTTRSFNWVELEVDNNVSALSDVRLYYAVVDDLPLNFPPIINTPVVLPVELSAWQARARAQDVLLEWRTASESRSSYFVVERALRPDADAFEAIGQRKAAGNSQQPLAYQLVDGRARQLGVTRVYYRLRQVDQDGRQTVSEVRTVQLANATYALQAYPSPATHGTAVQLHLTGPTEPGQVIRLHDSQGRVVATLPVERLTEGLATRTVRAGLYHITLQNSAGQRLATQKLLIAE